MPSIIPSYVYSLFATLLVGAIIVYTCSLSAASIKNGADDQQLTNIEEYVATQSLTLIAHTTQDSQNITQFLEIPSQIGNQKFWIRIANDSSNAWVESGFGATIIPSETRIVLPAKVAATGIFVSGSGRAVLHCFFEDQIATLTLTSE